MTCFPIAFTGIVLKNEEKEGELVTFMFAGHETSAHALTWAVSKILFFFQNNNNNNNNNNNDIVFS